MASLIISYAIPIIGVVICLVGMNVEGVKRGYARGVGDGYLTALEELKDGHMVVDGRIVRFDEQAAHIYKKGEEGYLTEMNLDEWEFCRE